jgi:hypothetical protein
LEALDAHSELGEAADKFRQFVHRVAAAVKPHNRGLCGIGSRRVPKAEQADAE